MLRYHPDGSLDTSFNGDGIAITPAGSGDAEARAVAIQPADGKIVVAGSAIGADANKDFAVIRYLSDGSIDTSFGSGGRAITALGSVDEANALLIQGDGKIVVVGSYLSSAGNNDFAVVRYTSQGIPDTFGNSGIVITAFDVGHDVANAVAIQPGNNTVVSPDYIVVAGYASDGANKNFAIARYTFAGVLDTSFDGDGRVTTPIGPGDDIGSSVRVQGAFSQPRKIIVAGSSFNGADSDFAVARYLSNGALDTTFNSTGLVTTPLGPGEDFGAAMIRQADGKIIVAGSSAPDAGPFTSSDFAVVRYDSAGLLDLTFDGNGIRTDDLGNPRTPATGVLLDADGKIVVTGSGLLSFCVMRQNADGSLDPTFDGDGRATIFANAGVEVKAAAMQADGKIVLAGDVNEDFAVARFHANGSPDSSFGSNGVVVTPVGPNVDRGNSVVIQPDGKIVVAGSTGRPGPVTSEFDIALVRYDSTGALDLSFNGTGKVITSLSTNDEATAVLIQPGGDTALQPAKIIVAGYTSGGPTFDFVVLRYNLNGSLDTSFDSDGFVITDIASRDDFAQAITLQGFGTARKIVVAGGSRTNSAPVNHFLSVVRYNLNGTLDDSFNGSGVVSTSFGTNFAFASAVRVHAGKIIVAGRADSDDLQANFAVLRYDTDGSLDSTYGNAGKVLVDLSNGGQDEGFGLAVDSSGRAVVAGTADGLFGVMRLLGDPLPTPTPGPTATPPTPTPTPSGPTPTPT